MADRRVIVEGLDGSITMETLVLYVESSKSGGGDVDEADSENKLSQDRKKACIVFENQANAERFLQGSHTLSNQFLTTQPWYSGWDMAPVTIRRTYSKPKKQPAQNSNGKNKEENIYESINEENMDTYVPMGAIPRNTCHTTAGADAFESTTYPPPGANDVYMDMGGKRPETTHAPAGPPLLVRRPLPDSTNVRRPLPEPANVRRPLPDPTNGIARREPEVEDVYITPTSTHSRPSSIVTETVKIYPENRDLLYTFIEFQNLKVEVEKTSDGFQLKGTKEDVENARLKLYEASARIEKVPISLLSAKGVAIISEPPCFDEMMEMFKNRQFAAILHKSHNMAYIVAKDSETATSCEELVKKVVSKREFTVDSQRGTHIGGKAWDDAVKSLTTPPRVHIECAEHQAVTVVRAEGMTDAVDTACAALESLLDEESASAVDSEKMELPPPIWRLFKEIAKLDELLKVNYGMEYGKITWTYQRAGDKRFLQIRGPANEIQQFRDSVKTIMQAIKYEEFTANEPGLSDGLFKQETFKRQLRVIEVYQQCCIEIAHAGMRPETMGAYAPDATEDIPYQQNFSQLSILDQQSADMMPQCPVKLQKGDLSTCRSDVLVCTVVVNATSLANAGAVAKGFIQNGGAKVVEGYAALCAKQKFKTLPLGDVHVTSATGNLKCKRIIYVPLKEWDRRRVPQMREAVKKIINQCLTKAHELKKTSICFPTIGCGGLHFPTSEVARCFAEAVPKHPFASKMDVSVICFEDKTQREFEAVLIPQLLPTQQAMPLPRGQSMAPSYGRTCETVSGPNSVSFQIHATDEHKLKNAISEIRSLLKDNSKNEEYTKECLKHLSTDEEKKLYSIKSEGVEITYDRSRGSLLLSGETKSVKNVRKSVNKLIKDVETRLKDPKVILVKDGVSAYLRALGSEEIQVPNHWSLKSGVRTAVKDCIDSKPKTSKADVKLTHAVEQLLAATWDQSLVGKGADAKDLTHKSIKVKNVYLNENPRLYMSYATRLGEACSFVGKGLARLLTINGLEGEPEVSTAIHGLPEIDALRIKEVNEYFLFHGVPTDKKDGISKQGLDFRLGGQGLFGKGVYFAESATKADQYSDRKKRHGGCHYMFVCRVLLNDPYVCKGSKHFNRPPCVENGCNSDSCDKHDYHDSVIGVEADGGRRLLFREFVVYDKDRCYPEFLVEYERV